MPMCGEGRIRRPDKREPCQLSTACDRLPAPRGMPDSVTVAQQILVLFVQVRILVGQLDLRR